MSRKVLTPAAAMEIKRLYGEQDAWGRGVYSQRKIARMLGVSETTVFRVLQGDGAYMALPEVKTEGEAEASQARFLEMMQKDVALRKAVGPQVLRELGVLEEGGAEGAAQETQETLTKREVPDAGY